MCGYDDFSADNSFQEWHPRCLMHSVTIHHCLNAKCLGTVLIHLTSQNEGHLMCALFRIPYANQCLTENMRLQAERA